MVEQSVGHLGLDASEEGKEREDREEIKYEAPVGLVEA